MAIIKDMKPPTELVKNVIRILRGHGTHRGGVDSNSIMRVLIREGHGKHPAAVAMHLTKLVWKGEYVLGYNYHGSTMLYLSEVGQKVSI